MLWHKTIPGKPQVEQGQSLDANSPPRVEGGEWTWSVHQSGS
jgi:hypothetical protein